MRQGPPIASWILWVLALVLAVGCGIFFVRHCPGETGPEPVIETRVDTLIVRDTIVAYKPVPVEVRVTDTVYVEVPVPAEDSVVYVPVTLEQREYGNSTYRAVVSGPAIDEYGPSLDTIEVYPETVVISKVEKITVEPSRWSIGIQAGYGASKDGLTPYIGVGVTYTLWAPKRRKAPP